MERCQALRRLGVFIGLLAVWLLNTGCWATWSELKKERHLREELANQFQAFKRQQLKRERLFQEQLKQQAAQRASLLAQMKMQSRRTQDLVDQIQKQVKQGQGGVAEMLVTLQKLQERFQSTLGQIGELQKQMQEIVKKTPDQDKHYAELKKKYEELITSHRALAEQAIPARMFARARDAFKKKDWSTALRLFTQFTKQFGSHDLADNAFLYIGDIHRQRGQLNPAIIAYDELVKRYPHGSETPVAMFRLGLLHYKLGLCRRGRKYFHSLLIIRRRAPSLAQSARKFYRGYRRLCQRSRSRRQSSRRYRRRRRRRTN